MKIPDEFMKSDQELQKNSIQDNNANYNFTENPVKSPRHTFFKVSTKNPKSDKGFKND